GVQLTPSVADENDFAATHPLKGRIILDGRRCRVPGAANADDPAALESRPVGGPEGEAHRVEIDQGPYRLAQSLENVAYLDAGSASPPKTGASAKLSIAARPPRSKAVVYRLLSQPTLPRTAYSAKTEYVCPSSSRTAISM